MDRRAFLKKGTATAAGLAASSELFSATRSPEKPIAKRPLGATGENLSIIGFGGIVVMSVEQSFANNIVAEAVDRGINYFDISPDYGDAGKHLGPALKPYRSESFLACKTIFRDKAGAAADLDNSLRRLRTDHFDLYQHHALTKTAELDQIFGPNGAMDRAHFDTILFPTNFVLFSKANFGPQVLEHARKKGVAYLAIKAMAKGKYPSNLPKAQHTPKCWYEPCKLPEEASLALRWTLSRPYLTAAIPPGNPKWFRQAMDVAQRFRSITKDETRTLLAHASGVEPIFQLHNNV